MLFYKLTKEQKQIVLLSSMGGMLEFYDFTIYGLFAVYFAHQFFPSSNQLISIIATYSVFFVGYVVRPLGGIFFSHIGDEIGRKTVLIITMILMGAASLGMGLIPTYEQIGVLAPILVLLCRLMQGLAIGGELPSMIVYVTESMPAKRGFGMGGVFAGTVSGLIPGMLINMLLTHYLTIEQINSFGWRIPFVIGGFLCFIAYQIRKKLHETTAFQNLQKKEKLPIFELLHHYSKEVIIGVALVSIMATSIILAIIFMPTYLSKIAGLPVEKISDAIFIETMITTTSIYVAGVLANKFDIVKLFIGSILIILIAAVLCYFGIAHDYNLVLSLGIFAVFNGVIIVLPPIFLSYLFPVHVRLTGVALSYNIAFVIFAGLTPMITTSIIEKTNWVFTTPLLLLSFSGLIAIIAAINSRKYITK